MKECVHFIVQLLIKFFDTIYDYLTEFIYDEIYCKLLNRQNDSNYEKSEYKENNNKRNTKKIIVCLSAIIFWLVLIFYPLYKPFYLSRIICNFGIFGCGWSIILWSYKYFRNNIARLGLFVVVSLIGILMYAFFDSREFCPKQLTCISVIESANDVNNTLSSFFPSRGDTDLKNLKKYEQDQDFLGKQNNQVKDKKLPVIDNPKDDEGRMLCFRTNFEVNCYILYHSLAYLAFGIMTMSLWGRRLVNYIKSVMTLDKNKFVFWGQELDERCLLLGQDIYKKHLHSEVIISLFDDRISNFIDEYRLYDALNKKDLILRIYDTDNFPFNSLFAPTHFFITNDETWNVKGCIKLLKERKECGIKNKVDIYIRLSEGEKCILYEDFLNSLQFVPENEKPFINIHVFNESDIIARDFVYKYPTLQSPTFKTNINHDTAKIRNETKINILILGFGWQGKQLLTHIVESSQFIKEEQPQFESPIYVDILDKNEKMFDQYKALRLDACKKYHLKFKKCDVMSSRFIDWMSVWIQNYDRIIISLGEDSMNLEICSLIQKLQRINGCKEHLEIFVKQNHLLSSSTNEELGRTSQSNIPIYFGMISSVYTNDIILQENIDTIAKYLNLAYDCQKNNKDFAIEMKNWDSVNKKWISLPLVEQHSNRSQAEGIRNILLLLGYDIKFTLASKNEECQKIMYSQIERKMRENKDDLLLTLAKSEHLRWSAFELMQGIKPWIINETTTVKEAAENNFMANQVKKHFRHAALVEFEQLSTVDQKLEKLKDIYENNLKPSSDFINNNSPLQKNNYLESTILQILRSEVIEIKEIN